MKDKILIRTSIVGTTTLAVCCFTPVLVWLFAILGLSALTGYLDLVLLPALGFFIVLTAFAVWREKKSERP